MRIVAPTPLLRAAAETLGPVRDEVVVVGALAVEIALSGSDLALTPTRDIDAGAAAVDVPTVVAHLEGAGFRRSEQAHERQFTWLKGDVKVQLMRPFHPFPPSQAKGLPENNLVSELPENRWEVALSDAPEAAVLWAARPAVLVALKGAAFGRTRPDDTPVDRDFSDAVALLDHHHDLIVEEASAAGQIRQRIVTVATQLRDDRTAIDAAAREMAATGQTETPRAAELTVARVAREVLEALA